MESYRIEFAKRVRKDFRRIPKQDAGRILESIRGLAAAPRPDGSKKLKGDDLYRVRIGAYRVIYEIFDNRLVVFVVKVGHRKDVYEK